MTVEVRNTSKPYNVKILNYKFFKDFLATQYLRYSLIRPGRKTHDPVINDIKCIKNAPDETIEVKIDYERDFTQLSIGPKVMSPILNYPPIFTFQPKITTEKVATLARIKICSPERYLFYNNILHA